MLKINRRIILLIVCILAGIMFCMQADAAKSKVKPKPKVKAKAKVVPRVVKGTTQLPGEWADFGVTYTLSNADQSMNFTLLSAEYKVEPIIFGEANVTPSNEQKALVLHFTLHNPNKTETFARFDTVYFTVVDSNDTNWEYSQYVSNEKDKEPFAMNMKPAQKVAVYTAILVPDKGEMPKLMVTMDSKNVLRYDLKGKVKGLSAQYADPSDKTGATPYAKIPAKPGEYYTTGSVAVKIDGIEYTTESINDTEVPEDHQYMLVKCSVKNVTSSKCFFRYDSLILKLFDADGSDVSSTDILQASKLKSVSLDLEPDKEYKFRLFFDVEKDFVPVNLNVSYNDSTGRILNYDFGSIK